MSDPRIPEEAVRNALGEVDELKFIERGGQGDAWRAVIDGEQEIVKVIVAASDQRRVEREVETLKQLNSEYVMGFIDGGEVEHDGERYPLIRGEFIAGGTVANRMQESLPGREEALACCLAAARGLAVIHEADLVHRDVKPMNVGLRDGDWSRAVILDLGLVRDLVGDSITVYPQLVGTVPFMAPEQLRQDRAVRRSDVFALGVLLFLLLSGQHPFFAPGEGNISLEEFHGRMDSDHWPDWSAVGGAITEGERAVLKKMLAFNGYERPRMKKIAGELEGLLGGTE